MHRFWTAMAAGTRLFVVYAIASLVPVVALGAVLAQTYKQDAVERGLEHGRAQAAVIEEMVFSPALRGALLTQGLTSAETARLQAATDLAIFHGSVLGLRLRSFDGTVVFSDDGALDGGLPATHPAFARAAAGGTHVTVLDDPVHGPAIRVLQPVVASASGRSVGVLELLLPYDAVDEAVKASTVRIYGGLGVGLGVLYVVLAGISWSVTRRLQGHAAAAVRDALHDSLTGLPNRELFRRRVEEACRQASPSAVALVDLDRFKSVNDTLGHHAGDELLREVARRLTDALRTDDVVARLGGDEFGILLTGTDGPAARRRLEEVRDEVAGEMVLDGVPMSVEASFGVASCPRDGRDVESLLRCADAAMYQGKRSTSGVVLFDPERATPQGPNPLGIQREMRRAIEQDELRLHYQPKIHLMTGATTCVEALVRWQHPERGLLPPGEFLPVVERSGLIGPLTEWVLRRALADCVAWRARGVRWSVAVNVSARNLESEGFADQVARLLAESGLPPASLQLEVTETALAVDTAAAARTLTVLAERGVATSLDDFGVGYASLSHLRSLALTEVKIDRGFVAHVESSDEDREVVRSLIQLAHGLGLTVTAEGVETEEAVTWLQAAGCDNAQGFHFSRPVPWETLAGGTTVPVQAARTPEMAP